MNRLTFHAFFASRERRPAASQELVDDDDRSAAPAAASRCGWYDSSSDLRDGLDVLELAPAPSWADTEPVAWPLG